MFVFEGLNPEELNILARVRNLGTMPASREVTLLVDGSVKDVQTIENLAPMGTADALSQLSTAAALISATNSKGRLNSSIPTGLAPKVLVSTMSAPASR